MHSRERGVLPVGATMDSEACNTVLSRSCLCEFGPVRIMQWKSWMCQRSAGGNACERKEEEAAGGGLCQGGQSSDQCVGLTPVTGERDRDLLGGAFSTELTWVSTGPSGIQEQA